MIQALTIAGLVAALLSIGVIALYFNYLFERERAKNRELRRENEKLSSRAQHFERRSYDLLARLGEPVPASSQAKVIAGSLAASARRNRAWKPTRLKMCRCAIQTTSQAHSQATTQAHSQAKKAR